MNWTENAARSILTCWRRFKRLRDLAKVDLTLCQSLVETTVSGENECAAPGAEMTVAHLVGDAPAIVLLREQLARLAALPAWPVLVCGEAGTGKALAARIIHNAPSSGAFLSAECKALSPGWLEQMWGQLTEQGCGTLLLRGIEELSETAGNMLHQQLPQPRGEGTPPPVGQVERPRVRVISAARLPFVEVRGRLPSELFQKISTFIVSMPPLRERPSDIVDLARSFLEQMSAVRGGPAVTLLPQAYEILLNYEWSENVRELRELMELAFDRAERGLVHPATLQAARASQRQRSSSVAPHSIELPKFVRDAGSNHAPALATSDAALEAAGLAEPAVTNHEKWPSAPPSSGTALVGKSGAFTSLPELEEHVITDIFRECNGNLSMAARTLGIPRSTLRDRLKKYGMAPVSVPKKQMGQ